MSLNKVIIYEKAMPCRTGFRDILDILITYFAIVLICFPLQFFHRGLRISIKIKIYQKVGGKLKPKIDL